MFPPRHALHASHLFKHPIVQWVLACAALSVIASLTQFTIIDDAYISFRHAYNLSTHGELSFNRGEHVEGMTNLLWTLVLAGSAFCRLFSMERFAVGASLVCLIWAALRLVQLARLLRAPTYAGLVACGLLFLTPDFLLAATSGLEGALFGALVLEMVYSYYRRHLRHAFLATGLLFLTRPESLALGVLLTGITFHEDRSWRRLQPGVLLLGSIVIGVTAWRLLYYGNLLPNSLIAKSLPLKAWFGHYGLVHFKLSAAYVAKFAFINWHFLLVLGLALGAFGRIWKKRAPARRLFALCLSVLTFSFLIILGNGGDWMPHSRLILYYGTLYSVLLLILMAERLAPAWVIALVIAYPFIQSRETTLHSLPRPFSLSIDPGPDTFDGTLAERLRPYLEPNDVLSAEALGYISYHLPENYVHDPIGLANKYLARHGTPSVTFGKYDPTYTVGVIRPSILVWHYEAHLRGVPQNLLDQYQTFCAEDCGLPSADIVMIRRDCAARFEPLFEGWQAVRLTTDGKEEPVADQRTVKPEERPSLRSSILW